MTSVSGLDAALDEVRTEVRQHRRLAAARQTVSELVHVPDKEARARHMLDQGNLLEAHALLAELELCRADLLQEVDRL